MPWLHFQKKNGFRSQSVYTRHAYETKLLYNVDHELKCTHKAHNSGENFENNEYWRALPKILLDFVFEHFTFDNIEQPAHLRKKIMKNNN